MKSAIGRFVAWRLCVAAAFVIAVAASAFLLVRLAPGDATTDLAMSRATPSAIEAARHRLGLDQSALAQLAQWVGGIARLDLGQSSRFGRPVAGLVGESVMNTAVLAVVALLIALAGIPLGILTGSRQHSLFARVIGALSLALVCCPPIIGTLALLFFGAATGWLSIAPGHLVLPALALALPLAAMLERLQSQAAAEALHAPDILAAAARGVPNGRLVWLHAGRHALRSVLGVAGIVMATLFSGSIVVETMAAWPGIGQLMLKALMSRDLYLVAGCAMAGAALLAVGNLLADLLRAALDPRVVRVS
ncbi:MAG TPA: ABC transporter permease [Vicinamibacterales bacterium]|nr:ABC transporter permease [Vicinamibacterales bacterium]